MSKSTCFIKKFKKKLFYKIKKDKNEIFFKKKNKKIKLSQFLYKIGSKKIKEMKYINRNFK